MFDKASSITQCFSCKIKRLVWKCE
uniref:Uncharacterized protein n=1 Tax=Arundo donax TaxID=35708 RepID=A0A0A9C6R3_ARUDO